MTAGRVAAVLGVLASIATILTFVISLESKPSPQPQPQPQPIISVSSANTTGPPNVVSSNQVGSTYPASTENSFLSTCSQNSGLSTSHCQCDLNWMEANYPYSLYSAEYGSDTQSAVDEAEAYANCP